MLTVSTILSARLIQPSALVFLSARFFLTLQKMVVYMYFPVRSQEITGGGALFSDCSPSPTMILKFPMKQRVQGFLSAHVDVFPVKTDADEATPLLKQLACSNWSAIPGLHRHGRSIYIGSEIFIVGPHVALVMYNARYLQKPLRFIGG